MGWTERRAWTHATLGIEGRVGVSQAWSERHGAPPRYLLVRAPGGGSRPLVLRTFVRVGEDEDLVLTAKQLADVAGGALTAEGARVEVRPTGRLGRLWHTPGTALGGDTAGWLLVGAAIVLASVTLAATAKLAKDLRDART